MRLLARLRARARSAYARSLLGTLRARKLCGHRAWACDCIDPCR